MALSCLVALCAVLLLLATGDQQYTLNRQPVAWGIYLPNAPSTPGDIDAMSALLGATPAIVMWYQDWVHRPAFPLNEMQAVAARGAVPMLTWEPWDNSLGTAFQPAYRLRNIANGDFDPQLIRWAQAARAWGKPLYLRFAQEMNGNWYSWGTGYGNPNGNTAGDFRAAWQHVHDLFRNAGATNVRWVWSPNIDAGGATPISDLYPGDADVDWVGLDGYNAAAKSSARGWRSLYDLFRTSYDQVVQLTAKPVMIAETASSGAPDDKAAWIRKGLLTGVLRDMPAVQAVVWFDEDKGVDWRLESSPAAVAAFREVVSTPSFRGKLR